MIVSTTNEIQGRKIKSVIGIVQGNTIRAKWFGKDILSGLRQIIGGELKEYTEMMHEAREQAYNRMVEDAKKQGADAIICMRFGTSSVMQSAAEVMAYGTAIKLE